MNVRVIPGAGVLLAALPSAAQAQAVAQAAGVGQMVFGLAIVIGLVLAMAWLARRLGMATIDQSSALLRRIAALPVGPRERIVIVEAGDAWLVLGVTAQSINTLHTLPKGEAPEPTAQKLAGGFMALLQKARAQHASR